MDILQQQPPGPELTHSPPPQPPISVESTESLLTTTSSMSSSCSSSDMTIPLTSGPGGGMGYHGAIGSVLQCDVTSTGGEGSSSMGDVSDDVDGQPPRQPEGGAPTYNEAFPPLMEAAGPTRAPTQGKVTGVWSKKMAVKSSTITQVFHIPVEEQRYTTDQQKFGDTSSDQARTCGEIMKETGAHIELSISKDQSLTLVISGKYEQVVKARRFTVQRLQQQARIQLQIPREHHRFILGRGGDIRRDLEMRTNTEIRIPVMHDSSDIITIVGTKEDLDRARHEIQLISDKQAKLGFERLTIEQEFHPFIAGPGGETASAFADTYKVRINIPPPSVHKNEITVAGDKDGVVEAVEAILKLYQEKKRKCETVSVEVKKSQHKYVIGVRGCNLQEILAETGVSVEVPQLERDSETITLRGEPQALGMALTMVYAKANSVVADEIQVPSWLHKYIIGKKGANIKHLTQKFPRVHIEFSDDEEKIKFEGPKEDVEAAKTALEPLVENQISSMMYVEIKADSRYHRHVIGKNGANVNRLKEQYEVNLRVPNDHEHSDVIRIEGPKEGVLQTKAELLAMLKKMENEISKDILIEQRFHKNIIGQKGDIIREIRDKFNQVMIQFPDAGKKSDVVQLRGPKEDVDKCFKHLTRLKEELVENNFVVKVVIFKQFHKNIIGKGGANIKKIRDETNTRIDLPNEASESDEIVITGKKKDVDEAKKKILAIQKELANIVQIELEIPYKLHTAIIGPKGRLIRSVMEDCGNVIITFPSEEELSDKVIIRGPKEDVEKAKKQVLELAGQKQLISYTEDMKVLNNFHRFLIGRGGSRIRKLREKHGVRIVFPVESTDDQDQISIIGKKEHVATARLELEELVKNLEQVIEVKMKVDPKHHRHFVIRQGQVLKEISDEFGNVQISFPRQNTNSDEVVVKGAKECCEGAKKRIEEIVDDIESQVTIDCVIPKMYHRMLLGVKGQRIQIICHDHNVQIKFPERESKEDNAAVTPAVTPAAPPPAAAGDQQAEVVAPLVNGGEGSDLPPVEAAGGDADNNNDSGEPLTNKKCDTIKITGRLDNCNAARDALHAIVPVSEEVEVPFDLHRFIIGKKGSNVRQLMEEFDVNISIPAGNKKSNMITLHGPPTQVEKCRNALADKVADLQKEQEDREARSYTLELEVDARHHPKIIGRKGAVINKIRQEHDVQIELPERGCERPDVIRIIGYQEKGEAARDDIMKIVDELESLSTCDVNIDHRTHRRLIGQKGKSIRKVMEDYKVDIRFPPEGSANPDLVIITGLEENIEECKDHLLNLEEEFLQDITEQVYLSSLTRPPKSNTHFDGDREVDAKGFVVRDAPWNNAEKPKPSANGTALQEAPNFNDASDFPVFGSSSNTSLTGATSAWGPRSKK